MLMEYWQNLDTNEIYGFDVSDPMQIQAMNKTINVGQWKLLDQLPKPVINPTKDQNKKQGIYLLQQTDWVNQPDVHDNTQPRYLINRQDFLNYRTQVREIVLDPVAGPINWPVMPAAQWSN